MKIGCNSVSFRNYPLDKALATIAEVGYEYVEIEGNLAWCSHVDTYRDDPIKIIQSNTSKALRLKFAFLQKVYWNDKGVLAKGYFVSTVGINEKNIKAYGKIKEEEDTRQGELEF